MGLAARLFKEERFFQTTTSYLRQLLLGKRIEAGPIFVLGCGHSGTSLLLRLLGAHSKIYGVPFESKLLRHPRIKQWLISKIWNRNSVAEGKHRWVEKTPRHIRRIKRLFEQFPEARVLFIVRDGRDVTVSLRKRFKDFEFGLRRWVDDNHMGLAWIDDRRVLMVRYEDLVQRYETIMPQICGFLDEDFEEGLIDYHESPAYIFSDKICNPGSGSGKDHHDYRNWQINQKLFDGSGKWKKEMSDAEKAIFKQDAEAMKLLIDFGYATNTDW